MNKSARNVGIGLLVFSYVVIRSYNMLQGSVETMNDEDANMIANENVVDVDTVDSSLEDVVELENTIEAITTWTIEEIMKGSDTNFLFTSHVLRGDEIGDSDFQYGFDIIDCYEGIEEGKRGQVVINDCLEKANVLISKDAACTMSMWRHEGYLDIDWKNDAFVMGFVKTDNKLYYNVMTSWLEECAKPSLYEYNCGTKTPKLLVANNPNEEDVCDMDVVLATDSYVVYDKKGYEMSHGLQFVDLINWRPKSIFPFGSVSKEGELVDMFYDVVMTTGMQLETEAYEWAEDFKAAVLYEAKKRWFDIWSAYTSNVRWQLKDCDYNTVCSIYVDVYGTMLQRDVRFEAQIDLLRKRIYK